MMKKMLIPKAKRYTKNTLDTNFRHSKLAQSALSFVGELHDQ